MKQILSILLAVLMLAALTPGAFTEEFLADDPDIASDIIDVEKPEVGLTLHIPYDLWANTTGHLELVYGEELSYGSGAYYTALGYFAMTDEEYENADDVMPYYAPLVAFVCMRSGCDQSAFRDAGINIAWENSWRMATVGNYTHYVVLSDEDADFPDGFEEPYISEFLSLLQPFVDLASTADYSEPVNPYSEQLGKSLNFETTTLDGTPVSSQDLFSQNEVTMINLWATWCGHCVGELPELARIHNELQSMGCGIVGILTDGQDPDDLETAKEDLADAGVTYPVVNMPENGDEMFDLHGLPISYFVDSSGNMVGVPIEGAQVDKYEQAVQDILAGNIQN